MPKQNITNAALVLSIAVAVYGLSFGVLAVAAGLSVAQTCVISLLWFTGASQFAAVAVVASGGTAMAAAAPALLLSARNGVYGIAMSRVLTGSLPLRLLASQLVIDESTAMATAQRAPEDQRRAFWATGIGVFVFWNLATLLGALGGNALGDPRRFGLDVAFPAGFVALVVPHLGKARGVHAGVLGAAIALACTPLLPAGIPIPLAALAALVGLSRERTNHDRPQVGYP